MMLLYITNDEGMVHDISYHPNLGRGDHACILISISCFTDFAFVGNSKV